MTSREATLNIENARRLGNIPVQTFTSNIENLEGYVLYRIKKHLDDTTRDSVEIKLSLTLPCGDGENVRYYAKKENLLGKTDAQLVDNFEMVSETFLNHAADWYCHSDTDSISIDLS